MRKFHCPRCKKKFKDQASVLKHMNQPHSWCRTRYEHLLAVSLLKRKPIQRQHLQPISADPTDSNCLLDVFSNPPNSTYDQVPDTPLVQVDPWHKDSNCTPHHVIEYPGASQIYGMGQTFMDKFDSDNYALQREQNLYYPFASRDEWEFASYLLRSSLSMSAINQLLRLELVSDLSLFFLLATDLHKFLRLRA